MAHGNKILAGAPNKRKSAFIPPFNRIGAALGSPGTEEIRINNESEEVCQRDAAERGSGARGRAGCAGRSDANVMCMGGMAAKSQCSWNTFRAQDRTNNHICRIDQLVACWLLFSNMPLEHKHAHTHTQTLCRQCHRYSGMVQSVFSGLFHYNKIIIVPLFSSSAVCLNGRKFSHFHTHSHSHNNAFELCKAVPGYSPMNCGRVRCGFLSESVFRHNQPLFQALDSHAM